ncbi:unnamed protein product [Penicillium pancosmium]
MLSPPKRRKTGDRSSIAISASQSREALEDRRSSPSRPSFQSPTKSSLAKSHPDVLERALSRSPVRRPVSRGAQDRPGNESDTGGFRRKAMRPSLGPGSPLKAPRMSIGGTTLLSSPSRRASAIEAFAKPPRRMSTKRINPSDFAFGSPMPTRPAEADTPEGQLALELGGSATREEDDAPILESGFDGAFDEDPLEPELPPTPTQLGLEKAPDRPRGLLSSSPSMRHEKRMKRRATDVIHGSPLKSARFRDPSPEESESLDTAIHIEEGMNLAAELQRLKKDVVDLTKWTSEIESGTDNLDQDGRELNKFLAMLTEESSYINRPMTHKAPTPISSLLSTLLPFSTNIPRPNRQVSPLPTNPFALKASSQSKSYLTVFAPLSLNAQTSRNSEADSLLETHTLKFTAPSPFPRALYNVSVVYETNPESQTITSVSVPTGNESKKRQVPETLRRWIDSRLANPLLNLDVATLCWGINRYWEASLARAQLWAQIEKKYGRASSSRNGKDKDNIPGLQGGGVIKLSELRRLVPHLERNTMVINPASSNAKPRILLSNVLTMDDWTGEPQLRPELSVSVSHASGEASKKIDLEAKKLFHGLLSEHGAGTAQGLVGVMRADVILRATNGALGVVLGS